MHGGKGNAVNVCSPIVTAKFSLAAVHMKLVVAFVYDSFVTLGCLR